MCCCAVLCGGHILYVGRARRLRWTAWHCSALQWGQQRSAAELRCVENAAAGGHGTTQHGTYLSLRAMHPPQCTVVAAEHPPDRLQPHCLAAAPLQSPSAFAPPLRALDWSLVPAMEAGTYVQGVGREGPRAGGPHHRATALEYNNPRVGTTSKREGCPLILCRPDGRTTGGL